MAYLYTVTRHQKARAKTQPVETVTVAPAAPKKAELVAQAEAAGIDASGTKADIAARLEASDG